MLKCNGCGYELTGLVKGPGAVRCPECGGETEHWEGRAATGAVSSVVLGRSRWVIACGPGMCTLLGVMIERAGIRPPWGFDVSAALVGAIVAGCFLVVSMVWVFRTERTRFMHPDDRLLLAWKMGMRSFVPMLAGVVLFLLVVGGLG